MELLAYKSSLIVGGIANLLMALWLLRGSRPYKSYTIYFRTRLLTALWLAGFGIGYLLHAAFNIRYIWPSAASALTCSYFHLGAICFCWGFIPLLNPNYLTRKMVTYQSALFVLALTGYWTVALLWDKAPIWTLLSFCFFFAYALYVATTFYRTYNKVTSRVMHTSFGSVRDFVRWMQVCCDCIVAFGIGSVLFTAIFPTSIWPYTLLMVAGTIMFAYIAYSTNNYGHVIDNASKSNNPITDGCIDNCLRPTSSK